MAFLIGTDEAGYGPALGPLVITATAWECRLREVDLFELLAEVVTDSPQLAKRGVDEPRLLIADSKVACRSGKTEHIERSVLMLLEAAYGRRPKTLSELVEMVMPSAEKDFLQRHFWLKGRAVTLPLTPSNAQDEITSELRDRFSEACSRCGVKLNQIRSTILLPPEFNAGVEQHGNKATLLSDRTLRLASDLMLHRSDDILIQCDKHGGRSYYMPMITKALTDCHVEIVTEFPAQSVYKWKQSKRDFEIRFTAKGEGQLPVALASMVSKYVREVFMVAWNDFWIEQIPSIKPTKGYPQDAKRFLDEINDIVESKRLSRSDFVRSC